MLTLRRTALASLALLFVAAACTEMPTTAPSTHEAGLTDVSVSTRAAETTRRTFTSPFPDPATGLEFVPVPAPCLGLGEPLQMSGTWTGWIQRTETADGRVHRTEHIDYSQIAIELDGLTWLPGPGASETIIINGRTNPEVDGAFNAKHEFHARFLSQDGLPDLRVSHSVKVLVDGNGDLRHLEFVPFHAECLGTGS